MSEDTAVDRARILTGFHHKFVETRGAGEQESCVLAELVHRIGSFGEVLFRQVAQPDLTVNRHKYICHERNQRLIRANVRGRFLTANVLFACRQS